MDNNEIKPLNTTYVYVRTWPFDVDNENVYPEDRFLEINNCTNEKVKGQKFYAWKLLEQAIEEVYGIKLEDIGVVKEGQKWNADKCQISISHSGNVVAIAVSEQPVGVDIEEENIDRFEKLRARIVHKDEVLDGVNLCVLWTMKEAVFKRYNRGVFNPRKINTNTENVVGKVLEINNKKYAISVSVENLENVEYIIL